MPLRTCLGRRRDRGGQGRLEGVCCPVERQELVEHHRGQPFHYYQERVWRRGLPIDYQERVRQVLRLEQEQVLRQLGLVEGQQRHAHERLGHELVGQKLVYRQR